MKTLMNVVYLLTALSTLIGCGTRTGNGSLPLLTPPVKASAPSALGGSAAAIERFARSLPARGFIDLQVAEAIDLDDFKERFFSSGPTYLYGILESIDSRLQEVNDGNQDVACLKQEPVEYEITPFGQTVPMYAQCYKIADNDERKFYQWGTKDKVVYLWVQIGAGNVAAIATPSGDSYSVQAWATVGNAGEYNSNGTTSANWDSVGSYGVMQIQADPTEGTFEMVVAGTGIGYCGAHLIADGGHIFGEGSVDMNDPCVARDPICVSGTDLSAVSGECAVGTAEYALTSIGRQAATGGTGTVFGASTYPAIPNIVLDGTSSDSLSFGPNSPTDGVNLFK